MSTYTPIASVTLTSAQTSVTFSGIPQTYTDLVLVSNITGVSAATDPWIRINSDTGTNYSWTWLSGNGSSAYSDRGSNVTKLYYSAISTIQNNVQQVIWNFNNYSNTTTYKTVLWRESDAGTEVGATVGLWRSTAAINAIEISLDSSRTYSAGTTFNLYGVANASITNTAKATGGDTITTDGTYWYHTFLSNGTFTPTSTLSADVLVVAGGGGGGNYCGGGGGGGICEQSSRSCASNTSYTVTVGAGGAGAPVYSGTWTRGVSGSNSIFDTITSNGGGGGGAADTVKTGLAGGSGGGGGAGNGTGGAANQGNSGGATGYGFAGGNGSTDGVTYTSGGGGGGAGAVGGNANSTNAGNGGNGRTSSISGSSVTYAGGGGGGTDQNSKTRGTGGTGGGGNGTQGSTVAGSAGSANTGGGGGGGGTDNPTNAGNAGGSGIVIVRYAV